MKPEMEGRVVLDMVVVAVSQIEFQLLQVRLYGPDKPRSALRRRNRKKRVNITVEYGKYWDIYAVASR